MSNFALDNLAANGVINYDADAFVKGANPRFVGDPDGQLHLPFEQPLMTYEPMPSGYGPQLVPQAGKDEFRKASGHSEGNKSNLDWKKALFGAIIGGGAIFGGVKLYNFKKNRAAAKAKKEAQKIAAAASNAPDTAKKAGFIKRTWNKIKGSAVSKKIETLPKAVKYGGVGIIGLLGLYGLYNTFGKKSGPTSGH